MPRFEVIEGKEHHCGQMVRLMRIEHQKVLATVGVHAHRELRNQFDSSCFRRAWLIDGKLAALGGVHAMRLSAWGFVWLVLSEQATRYPVAIIKESRRQLDEIMVVKRELVTTVFPEDAAAKRLAIFLGFHITDSGPGAPAHTRLARQTLSRTIDTIPDIRVPVGAGYAVPMGYHHAEHV